MWKYRLRLLWFRLTKWIPGIHRKDKNVDIFIYEDE